MSILILCGTTKQIDKQIVCDHIWYGPCIDEISRYSKCTKCFCLERDMNEEDYYKAFTLIQKEYVIYSFGDGVFNNKIIYNIEKDTNIKLKFSPKCFESYTILLDELVKQLKENNIKIIDTYLKDDIKLTIELPIYLNSYLNNLNYY
jgi:hypothetical protein